MFRLQNKGLTVALKSLPQSSAFLLPLSMMDCSGAWGRGEGFLQAILYDQPHVTVLSSP